MGSSSPKTRCIHWTERKRLSDSTDVAGSHRNHDDANGAEPENGKPLSNQLTERLTAERTVALQECLAGKPEAALMAVVHALALRVFYRQEFRGDTCLGLEAKIAEPETFAPSVAEAGRGTRPPA